MKTHGRPFRLASGLRGALVLATTVVASGLGVSAERTAGEFTDKRGVNIRHRWAQNFKARPCAAAGFEDEDVAWIAAPGFDHIRFAIDGREGLKSAGWLDNRFRSNRPFPGKLGKRITS